ncbi:MAG: bifunctional glycosyltransferase family 2/GtrA family protein [Oscillospiraceae bacterium]|nr:bifunctional glycosyltransferase family 2/GtrA family protein [Oscillospiraceae bacterium]
MEKDNPSILREPSRYVVIPVYQPSDQLVRLVYDVAGVGYEVLIVDDGSDPAYSGVWNSLNNKATIIHHRVNQGKGAAIKTAFQYLLKHVPDVGLIVTMDADGQHLPKDMERVIETAAAHPSSLVLGVRQFDKNVPVRSRFGNKITRAVFSAVSKRKVTDTQTGLRAFDRSILDFMLEIPGERYEYEMNMLLYCGKQGISIQEVPIQTVYLDKQNTSSHFNALKDSLRIYIEIIKFASSSLVSFAVDYAAFLLLVFLTVAVPYHLIISNIVARIVSASVNYTINKHMVFHEKENTSHTLPQYVMLAFGVLCANSVMLSFFDAILGLPPHFAKPLTELILFIISFTVQATVIFKPDHSASCKKENIRHA